MQSSVRSRSRIFLLLGILVSLWLPFWFSFSSDQGYVYAEERAPDAFGSISGVIRNSAGEPLAGMRVTLYNPYYFDNSWYPTVQVTTDQQGRYRFSALVAGIYRIGAQDPDEGYGAAFYANQSQIWAATDVVANGAARTNIDLTLARGGEITGVIRAQDGSTLTGLTVALYQQAGPLYLVDGQWNEWLRINAQELLPGESLFHFRGLAADNYRLCASAYSNSTYWQECYDNVYTVVDAQTLSVTAGAIISNVVMILGDGANLGMIQGQVTSPQNEPLANIGVYVVPADAASYVSLATTVATPTAAPSAAQAAQAAASRQGLATATPAPTAFPPNVPYQSFTTTAADGSYTVKNLYNGNYQLLFHDPTGRYRYEYYNDVTYRSNAEQLPITPKMVVTGVNAQLALGAHITGTITLQGQPAPPSTLFLHRQEHNQWFIAATTTSDPLTGGYDLGGLPAGVYRLQAATTVSYTPLTFYSFYTFYGGSDWSTATQLKLTTAEIRPEINIDFNSGPRFNGAISGRVTADGAPQAGIKVSLYSYLMICCEPLLLRPPLTYGVTDQTGRYRIEGLSDGIYYLRFDDQRGRRASLFYPGQPLLDLTQYLTTTDTATTTALDIALPQGGMVAGHVAALTGQIPSNLTILATLTIAGETSFVYREVQVNADGTYLLQGLYPGTYHVCATSKAIYGYGYTSFDCYGAFDDSQWFTSGRPITVTAGQTVNEIDLLWGADYKRYLPVVVR